MSSVSEILNAEKRLLSDGVFVFLGGSIQPLRKIDPLPLTFTTLGRRHIREVGL